MVNDVVVARVAPLVAGRRFMLAGDWNVVKGLFAAGAMHDSPASMNLLCYEPRYHTAAGTGVGCGFAYWQ